MNTQKQAMSKIAQIQKEELSSEKVELARKPEVVFKELQSLDSRMRKVEDKMSQAYKAYKNAYSELDSSIAKESAERKRLEKDLNEIDFAARELGVMPSEIKGFNEAAALSTRLDQLFKDLPNLYDKV